MEIEILESYIQSGRKEGGGGGGGGLETKDHKRPATNTDYIWHWFLGKQINARTFFV